MPKFNGFTLKLASCRKEERLKFLKTVHENQTDKIFNPLGTLALIALTTLHIDGLKKSISIILILALLFLCMTGDYLYSQTSNGRIISIYNIHTKETLTVTYKKNGQYIPSALKKVNHIMRDWRRNESRAMRRDLIDLMWKIHNQTGSQKPIYLISGYRSLKTNNKLRKTRGGQARRSRHILGMAADIHFPDIPIRELRETALIRERGGVGYYPTSGLPFVHIDVGRVRHWPRATRAQLARIFPKGRSKHIPSDGRPLTKADARKYGATKHMAKMRKIQIARSLRRDRAKGTAVASLTPPAVKTSLQPTTQNLDRRALDRQFAALEKQNQQISKPETKQPTAKIKPQIKKDEIRKQQPEPWWRDQTIAALNPQQTKLEEEQTLVQLASIDTNVPKSWQSFIPRKKAKVIEPANVAYSPEVDEEHEDELNYRPFAIGPLITDKPVADDENLAKLTVPDYAQTGVIISVGQTISSSRFRPGLQFAYLKWATEFIGSALPDPLSTKTNKR